MAIIYCAHCITTNKKYIGQTINSLSTRKNKHKSAHKTYKKKNKFYSALKKHGWDNFIWGIVEEVDQELLNEKEKYWIDYFSTFEHGYNSTLGGHDNMNLGKEFAIMDPKGNIHYGKNIAKFARQNNLSSSILTRVILGTVKSHRGWKLPDTILKEKRKNNTVVSPLGEIFTIINFTHFANLHDLCPSHLIKVLEGKRKHHKGWTKYEEDLNNIFR